MRLRGRRGRQLHLLLLLLLLLPPSGGGARCGRRSARWVGRRATRDCPPPDLHLQSVPVLSGSSGSQYLFRS
jgi:hypothetical protein